MKRETAVNTCVILAGRKEWETRDERLNGKEECTVKLGRESKWKSISERGKWEVYLSESVVKLGRERR